MNKILHSIVKKEFIHIVRDPQTLIIIILMPVLMLFLYGYAITLEMKEIRTVIVDLSRTPESRDLIQKIVSTDFFRITDTRVPYDEIEEIFYRRDAQCVLIIPEDFARSLAAEPRTPVQLLVDASDPNAANYIQNYLAQINSTYIRKTNPGYDGPFSIEPRILYNPDFESADFFVPGLIAVIILLISALLTSIAIVREKETGTMEQILVSPVRSGQIIVGKVIPYIGLGFLDSVLILLVGHLWFQVPMKGSPVLLGFTLILYILTGLCFGLLVSIQTRSQRVAMMAVMVATILPSFMLSGFIFPVRSMPSILQIISRLIPATHFLKIIRGIMLKGTGFGEFLYPILFLAGFSLFFLMISIKRFHTRLE